MYETELALLSRLIFVDCALMAQSYKLLSKSGFIRLQTSLHMVFRRIGLFACSYTSFYWGFFFELFKVWTL